MSHENPPSGQGAQEEPLSAGGWGLVPRVLAVFNTGNGDADLGTYGFLHGQIF